LAGPDLHLIDLWFSVALDGYNIISDIPQEINEILSNISTYLQAVRRPYCEYALHFYRREQHLPKKATICLLSSGRYLLIGSSREKSSSTELTVDTANSHAEMQDLQ
jgi:hypothetical protein